MILFSELFVGGYGSSDALVSDNSSITVLQTGNSIEYHGSSLLEPIRDCCRDNKVGVVFGFSERVQEDTIIHYNSAVAVGDDGNVLAVYRKVHLWGKYECSLFTPSNDLLRGCFDFHGIRCGMLICFDVEFPESVRMLRMNGVEIVFVPTALANSFNALVTVPSRAFENGCVVCYANNVGADPSLPDLIYCGLSVIAMPDGSATRMSGSVTEESLSLALVDLEGAVVNEARARNDYLACRRPELYRF